MRTGRLTWNVLLLVVSFHLHAAAQDSAPAYTISTLAGGARPHVSLSPTAISIGNPTSIAADSLGNVYFAVRWATAPSARVYLYPRFAGFQPSAGLYSVVAIAVFTVPFPKSFS